ncbi:amidohydrolase [uncultured Nocardioides sp.]|uniref:amidohydrolase n=1 Tax=uncultured Nocardioides sp. TaxID=198441 RepID=UPI00262537A8|nr:amidohydrolase [uncultured Nocardioides sp.]
MHQHLWPEPLVEALRRRRSAPRLEGWELHLDGEPACPVDPAAHDLAARRATDRADGVDLTLLSLSAPLGIERLPAAESAPLLEAWHGLADHLDDGHGLWAAPRLVEPDPCELAATLAHPRVHGLQVPADALATPGRLEALAPTLAVAEAAGLPVLVHPGPAAPTAEALPSWWPALTSYVAQQAAAWHAWHVAGRALLPTLRVVFVGLAGLAPLHHERLTQRGGSLGVIDPGVFYETSSYGGRAVDAMARVVGVDPLVLGSDRPYAVATDLAADPGLGEAFARAVRSTNPLHLLQGGPR